MENSFPSTIDNSTSDMPSETTDEIFLNDIFNTYIPKIIQDDVFEQGNLAGSVDFEGQDQVFSPVSTRPATWIGRSCSAWQSFDSVDCKVDFSYSPDTRQGNIFEDNDIFEYSVSLAQYQDFSSPSTEATIRAANSLLVQPNIDSIGFGINDPYLSDTIEASILGNEHGFERPNFIRPDQMFSTINTDLVIQSDQTKSGDSNSIQRENADQHFGLDHISVLDKSTNNERIVKETHFSAAQRTALKPHSFETCTSVFSAHPSAGRIRKRRRLEPGPRKATSEVRRIGACLGCMLGKRRCSPSLDTACHHCNRIAGCPELGMTICIRESLLKTRGCDINLVLHLESRRLSEDFFHKCDLCRSWNRARTENNRSGQHLKLNVPRDQIIRIEAELGFEARLEILRCCFAHYPFSIDEKVEMGFQSWLRNAAASSGIYERLVLFAEGYYQQQLSASLLVEDVFFLYYFKLNICNACRILESRSFEHVPFIHFPFGPVRDLIEAAEKRSLEALQKLIKGVHPPGRDKCIPLFVSLVLLFGYYNDARKFWARFGAQNGKPQENLASRLCQQILGMYKVLFSAGNPLEFDWTAKDKLDLLGGNRELASQLQTFCGDARHYRIEESIKGYSEVLTDHKIILEL